MNTFSPSSKRLDDDVLIGRFPDALVHLETDFLKTVHENALEIVSSSVCVSVQMRSLVGLEAQVRERHEEVRANTAAAVGRVRATRQNHAG